MKHRTRAAALAAAATLAMGVPAFAAGHGGGPHHAAIGPHHDADGPHGGPAGPFPGQGTRNNPNGQPPIGRPQTVPPDRGRNGGDRDDRSPRPSTSPSTLPSTSPSTLPSTSPSTLPSIAPSPLPSLSPSPLPSASAVPTGDGDGDELPLPPSAAPSSTPRS